MITKEQDLLILVALAYTTALLIYSHYRSR